jgi:hypothetical protein
MRVAGVDGPHGRLRTEGDTRRGGPGAPARLSPAGHPGSQSPLCSALAANPGEGWLDAFLRSLRQRVWRSASAATPTTSFPLRAGSSTDARQLRPEEEARLAEVAEINWPVTEPTCSRRKLRALYERPKKTERLSPDVLVLGQQHGAVMDRQDGDDVARVAVNDAVAVNENFSNLLLSDLEHDATRERELGEAISGVEGTRGEDVAMCGASRAR